MTHRQIVKKLLRIPLVTGKSYQTVDEMIGDIASDEFLRFWSEGRPMRPFDLALLRKGQK